MNQYLVIDVGGSAIKYAIMDEEANILNQGDIPTPHDDLEGFLKALDSIVLPVKNEVKGIAISMPGRIDNKKGFAYTGGALRYILNTPIGDILNERYALPIAVENDGKCAALAEAWQGNLSDVNSGVVVILGTGIGGGIVLDQQVWRGFNGAAGELSAVPGDFANLDNSRKSWAAINGVPGLIGPYASLKNVPLQDMNGKIFFKDLLAGDEEAKQVFKNYIKSMTAGIINIQAVLDVERICIGGGISAQDILIDSIREGVQAYFKAAAGRTPLIEPQIDRCKFKNDANLIGALKNFFNQQ